MKLYKLIDSKEINHIITSSASPVDAYLTIYYKEKRPVTKQIAIVATIKNLVKDGSIDTTLATALMKDFPHMLTELSFKFAECTIQTPYILDFTGEFTRKQEIRVTNSSQTDNRHIPWDKRYLSMPEQPEKHQDTDLQKAILLSLEDENKNLQQTLSVSTQTALLSKTKSDYVEEDINSFVRNKFGNNTNNATNSYNFFEAGEEVATQHKISNFVCTFVPLKKEFSLTISSIGSAEVSLKVSRKIKQDIRSCDNLLESATILRTVPDGQSIADKMQRAYEQEQRDIQREYDDLQNYNDSDSDEDAKLWDEFIDDDCQYDSSGSGLSL